MHVYQSRPRDVTGGVRAEVFSSQLPSEEFSKDGGRADGTCSTVCFYFAFSPRQKNKNMGLFFKTAFCSEIFKASKQILMSAAVHSVIKCITKCTQLMLQIILILKHCLDNYISVFCSVFCHRVMWNSQICLFFLKHHQLHELFFGLLPIILISK